jgi:NAD(P)-dependent dehydrogenase (short-subunit alcohol dehydrogenase family)
MFGLEGRTALVTGAANGIGLATVRLLANAGVSVLAVDVQDVLLEDDYAASQGKGAVVPFIADVSQPSAVQAAVDFAVDKFGGIDITFANAAIQWIGPAASMSEEEWDRLIDVNLKGIYLLCRSVIPIMQWKKAGSIIITASGHAFATYRGFAAYAAAKGAAVAFMRGIALDYAADGIRANCVIPGATDTRMLQSYFEDCADAAGARAQMIETIPLHRLATPEDIAKAVLFLASDYAAYITGTCLAVDGGLGAQG